MSARSANSSTRSIFEVLRLICATDAPIGVAEVSRRVGLATSTAHRALATLEETRFIKRLEHSSKFVPGEMAAHIVRALFGRYPIRAAALPYLRQLSTGAGLTSTLSVRLGWYSVRIAVSAPAVANYAPRRLGSIHTLLGGAASRAILGHLPDHEIRAFLTWLQQSGSLPPSWSRRGFWQDLSRIRECGYAVEKAHLGDHSIAFPVRGQDSVACAAITIDGAALDSPAAEEALAATWANVARELEALIQRSPETFADPFGHIDPALIELPTANS